MKLQDIPQESEGKGQHAACVHRAIEVRPDSELLRGNSRIIEFHTHSLVESTCIPWEKLEH